MKSATDPAVDYKRLVQEGYDRCAAAYAAARPPTSERPLELLVARLGKPARVLDVGCGAGLPVARDLADRYEVVGVDLSEEIIRRARGNVPAAEFVHSDIMTEDLPNGHFDAVVAFYAIFHLPREEHRELLARVHRWLRPGGYLLATFTRESEGPYMEDDFFGVPMFWSHFGLSDYRVMLEETGFRVLETREIGSGYAPSHHTTPEHHPLVLVQKRSPARPSA